MLWALIAVVLIAFGIAAVRTNKFYVFRLNWNICLCSGLLLVKTPIRNSHSVVNQYYPNRSEWGLTSDVCSCLTITINYSGICSGFYFVSFDHDELIFLLTAIAISWITVLFFDSFIFTMTLYKALAYGNLALGDYLPYYSGMVRVSHTKVPTEISSHCRNRILFVRSIPWWQRGPLPTWWK